MNKQKTIKFCISIFGPILLGIIVGILINNDSYLTINKPFLSPPAILFPIVWSILYLLMGISLYLVLKENHNKKAIYIFISQLLVNLLWPIIFFNFKLYYLSSLWILLLISLVIKMIVNFLSIKKIAAYIQFPYFIWLLFALYLNIGVALLN